jgi:hypothetical protein
MPKPEAIVTLMIDRRIVQAECSICHDVILARGRVGSIEDQEAELRDAINRHARQRHSEISE